MTTSLLVTGAGGTVGRQVVKQAADAGLRVRAAVRRKAPGQALPQTYSHPNVTPVELDLDRPETFRQALDGVQKLFVLTAVVPQQVEQTRRLVEAAAQAGVEQVIKLSAGGADPKSPIQLGRWHGEAEEVVKRSGLPWTFVRPCTFMQNFLGSFAPDREGKIHIPLGQGAVAYVDAADVAAVVVATLKSDGHLGRVYDVTGPEASTIPQIAAAISAVTGRAIRHVDIPEDAARAGMASANLPPWFVQAMLELLSVSKAGYLSAVSPVVRNLTGREPRSFAQFARDHAAVWSL
jgi:uncharacterized protein YbjT (DUF2867 family)